MSNETLKCAVPAAAALTPGVHKHGKMEDIYYLYVFLAHVHVSVLKETAN